METLISKRRFIGGFAALAASVLLSCTKQQSDEIKIGVYGPFSGGTAALGISMRNGLQLAADEINASGGINGKKIKLITRDDESKNDRGGPIAMELLDREKVVALFGPVNTGVADASSHYANKRKVPQIITASSGAKVNDHFKEFPENYVFRFAAADDIQSKVIVNEAVTTLGKKKVAIICDDTNFGQAGRNRLLGHLKTLGIEPVHESKFRLKDTDMTPQLQEARAAGADVLLAYGIGPELAAVSNSLNRIGWSVPMVGSWTLSSPSYLNNAGKNSEGVRMPMTFIESSPHDARTVKVLDTYRTKFNEKPIQSPIAAVQSYDAMYLLKQAMEQAGSFEGAKVRAALENLSKPFDGLSGKFDHPYSASNHEAFKDQHVKVGQAKDSVVVPRGDQRELSSSHD